MLPFMGLDACWMSARRALLILVAGVGLSGAPFEAHAQAAKAAPPETLDVDDEPGRVSTEEVVISEGPFARQAVFFRPNEAPAPWSSTLPSGSSFSSRVTIAPCATESASGVRASSGPGWCGSVESPNGQIGAPRRR